MKIIDYSIHDATPFQSRYPIYCNALVNLVSYVRAPKMENVRTGMLRDMLWELSISRDWSVTTRKVSLFCRQKKNAIPYG